MGLVDPLVVVVLVVAGVVPDARPPLSQPGWTAWWPGDAVLTPSQSAAGTPPAVPGSATGGRSSATASTTATFIINAHTVLDETTQLKRGGKHV